MWNTLSHRQYTNNTASTSTNFPIFTCLIWWDEIKKKYEKNCAWWIRCFPTTEFNERKKIKKHPLKMPNSIQYTLNNNSLYIYNFQQLRFFVPYFICVSFSVATQNRTYIPIHNICFVWFAAIKCKVAFIVDDFGFFFIFFFSRYTLRLLLVLYWTQILFVTNFHEFHIIIDEHTWNVKYEIRLNFFSNLAVMSQTL